MQPLVSLNLKQYALDAWKTVENCTERKIVKLVGHVKHDFAMVCFRYGTIRKKKSLIVYTTDKTLFSLNLQMISGCRELKVGGQN